MLYRRLWYGHGSVLVYLADARVRGKEKVAREVEGGVVTTRMIAQAQIWWRGECGAAAGVAAGYANLGIWKCRQDPVHDEASSGVST